MAWTEITRAQYRRDRLRYASDPTDAEWLLLAFFHAAPCRLGRPREVDLRAVVNAILYVLATGCQWRALPKDFPPRSTVQYYFYLWRDQRIWRRINLALVRRARAARDATPIPRPASSTARASRPRKAAARAALMPPSGSRDASATSSPTPRAFCSPSWCTPPTSRTVMARCRCSSRCGAFPKLRHIFADRVYRGDKLRNAIADFGRWTIEIVTRSERVGTFKPEPKRWVDRAHLRLARTQPPPRQGLRALHRQRRGLVPDRQRPPALPPPRKGLKTRISF